MLACLTVAFLTCQARNRAVESPDGSVTVMVGDTTIVVSKNGQEVQTIYVNMPGKKQGRILKHRKKKYEMLSGKRRKCLNVSNDCLYTARSGSLMVKVFNDGVAYKIFAPTLKVSVRAIDVAPGIAGMMNDYMYMDTSPESRFQIPEQEYIVADGTRRWMQTLKTDYEGFYPMTEQGRPGSYGYPALLQYGKGDGKEGLWGLIAESGVAHAQSGSHLDWNPGRSSYAVTNAGDPESYEDSRYPGRRRDNNAHLTPWRVLILGTLSQVVESTLVTDLASPCKIDDTSWIKPGVSAWIYWAYNHSSKDFEKVKEYIDLAAEMHWPYNLIDWEWDVMSNGGDIEDALAYAASRGVKANLWYNSGTSWTGKGAPGPQDRLLTAEAREKEMARLEAMGATGIKVDFFLPDGPDMIDYYLDILSDAARHHLLVDFHGCTVPRGWSRTWPNLMSMEAVYGAEWYNNNRSMTNAAPAHNATLPFTRNVIGPMDYTPCTFTDSQNPHITTDCHELALPILFESGLQHMADRPESYLGLPPQVKQLLQDLPAAWDDTRLLAGYPGQSAVIARRSGKVWYIAGINGTSLPLSVTPDWSPVFGKEMSVTIYQDKGDKPGLGFDISQETSLPSELTVPGQGGFVMVVRCRKDEARLQ